MIKLFKNLKPYWKNVVGVLTFTMIGVLCELFLPRLMGNIVDKGVVNGDINYILKTGIKMVVFAVIGTCSMIVSAYLSSKAATGFGKDLRRMVFTKVEGFSLNEMEKIGTSSLITRTINDINQMQQVAIMSMRMMVRAPLMLIGGFVMAFSTNSTLSRILLLSGPLLIIVIALIGKIAFPFFKKIQEKIDNINKVMREELSGIRVIRAFNKVGFEKVRFEKANRDLTETFLKVTRIMTLVMPLIMIILNFTNVAVIWFGSNLISTNDMEVGQLMAFIQYVMQIMFSLIMVSVIFIMFPRASASASRINEVLDLESEIVDGAEKLPENKEGDILELKDVTFNYFDSVTPAIKDVSFKVKKGETTAIIGGTGSGKSTILNLIMRFFDPVRGEILLNGKNIKDISQEELRKHFSLVPQKTVLFTGTIRDNIKMGKEDATDEEIIEALKIAQAYDFVLKNKEGLDYIISQGGKNLSGGQKQRLSIARAIVRRPDFYLFDDSFSALDFKTDKILREELKKVTQNSGVLIVAQRISTIMDAETIVVLDDGVIVGVGNHKELLKTCEVYREIAQSQLGEEALKDE
ncbi:MAG TPA: ABC transporter ATP-binding protein [Soehngenia sp.]|nr:ABC transporter ATP-binding protein [Soehngenia sp.]HPP31128.1 ABC transporter ATP-binding protein [Soehngenia sp.]